MTKRARHVLVGIVAVGALALAGIVGYFAWQDALYVKTDDAAVAGNVVYLYAGDTGTLTKWSALMGTQVTAGTILGTVQPDQGAAPAAVGTPRRAVGSDTNPILAPINGVIVQSAAVTGQQVVAATTLLGVLADTSHLWVVANVDEGSLGRIHAGERVDIHADALPDGNLGGSVATIGRATLSTLSTLPTTNGGGSFTKVTQRVPVRIDLDNNAPSGLPVGSSVEVAIHVS